MTTGRAFDVKQAATYLGCHPETIRRAYRAGELVGWHDRLKVGRPLMFSQENLEAFKADRQSA